MEREFLRGRKLRAAGEHDRSLELLSRVLEARQGALGLDHDQTQVVASQIGRTLRAMGRFDEAVRRHEQVLTFRLGHYGREHDFTQNSVRILAETQRMAGREERTRAVESHYETRGR